MQDERGYSENDGRERNTCGKCSLVVEQVEEDWMLRDEKYYKCSAAYASIGLVEHQDDACALFKPKQHEIKKEKAR